MLDTRDDAWYGGGDKWSCLAGPDVPYIVDVESVLEKSGDEGVEQKKENA